MFAASLSDPAENGIAVTPSDTVNLKVPTRGITAGVAGNISLEIFGGDGAGNHTLVVAVLAGLIYPIRATRINSTSTTATSIVALW